MRSLPTRALFIVPKLPAKISDEAHLHDMLEAACRIRDYTRKVTFDEFRNHPEKRDAVALRLSVLGEAAAHISPAAQKALASIPFRQIRGLRNRIPHDYGAIDFKIVWEVTRHEIKPLIHALEKHFGNKYRA
jgi:uncharacterized protein with HEPN domain